MDCSWALLALCRHARDKWLACGINNPIGQIKINVNWHIADGHGLVDFDIQLMSAKMATTKLSFVSEHPSL